MWVNLFFFVPGRDTPPTGVFFTLFIFGSRQFAAYPGQPIGSPLNRAISVTAIVFVAVMLTPVVYAMLLPNYHFPKRWVWAATRPGESNEEAV